MCGPEDPLFTPLLPLARVPFQAKESVHKTPFWENLEILASTASIFTQILAHKPPNGHFQLTSPQIWKFSAHKPPFSEANVSSQAHTSEIRAAHLYLKKSWVPSPGDVPAGPRKSDYLYTNFLPNFPPISIPFSKEKHPIWIKLGAFYNNLPKIHPIYVIWAPSSLMKTLPSLYQISRKSAPKGRHIY